MFLRETFFLVRAYPSVRPSVFRRWVFLFATDLPTKMGVTDELVPSVRPSVMISPTEFIPVTDRSSPSIKLFNGVVIYVTLGYVCFLGFTFRKITFQTFLCLFTVRKVGQRKILSRQKKIWLGFQESVFLKNLGGKHFPEVVNNLEISY